MKCHKPFWALNPNAINSRTNARGSDVILLGVNFYSGCLGIMLSNWGQALIFL